MQLKQANLVLAVSMTIVAVIVAVSAILVVISFSGSSQTAEDRTEKFNKFQRTCDQDPSPTADNIDRLSSNIDVVSDWYDSLLKDLGRDIVFRSVDTASVFGSRREQVINGLRADAPLGLGGAKVIPDGFMFGFEAYREGKMATREEVPRLLYQLELIDAIVREMYAAKVLSITRVEREIFEQSTGGEDSGEEEQSSGRRGRRGRRDSDSEESGASGGLTAANKNGDLEDFPLPLNRQKFHFEFLAREESLVDLLNRLASMDRYVAVTSLEFAKTGSDFAPPKEEREARGDGPGPGGPGGPGGRPPRRGRFGNRPVQEEAAPAAAAAPAAPAAPASRLARSFSGRNLESPIRVQLNVEVYAVRRDETQEAPAEETPEASSDEIPAADAPAADAPAEAPAEATAETPAEAPSAEAPAEAPAEAAPAAEAPAAEAPAAPAESAFHLSTPSVLMRGQAALPPHAQAALLEI